MPAAQIAQNLAFINWTVLTGLALGSYATVFLLRRRTTATRGYLGFTTACAIAFGILAWSSDGALPGTLGDSPVVLDPAWDGLRRTALLAFCILAAAGLVGRRFAPRPASVADSAAVAAAGAALGGGALAWGAGAVGSPGAAAGARGRDRRDRGRSRP